MASHPGRRHLRKASRYALSARLIALTALTGLIVAGAPVGPRAAAEVANVPRTTVTDLGTSVHDLVIDGGSLWATLPDRNRVSELDVAGLAEQRRVLVGSSPRGIDVLDDGQLAIALEGATGYVELDPVSEALTTVTLPLLNYPGTWDVANVGDDKVVVSSNVTTGGYAFIVGVDRSAGSSSTRVASSRFISAGPVFADSGSTVLIGEGFESLYRLDGTDPSLPVVAEDREGDLALTQHMAISPDGSHVYLGSGQVVRTSDLAPVAAISLGIPVLDPDGNTVYALAYDHAAAFETSDLSQTAEYDLSGCGFTNNISAALMPTATTIVIAAGSRICRIDLDQPAGPPTTPPLVNDPPPGQFIPPLTTTDLGTSVHDLVMGGGSLWATLPDENQVAELDAADLAEQQRVLVEASPRGIDVLDDGDLVIALHGATGYVELDPSTGAQTTVTLPLLGSSQTWDVANIGNDKILVSSNPGAVGGAYIVRVDRSEGRTSTVVASRRLIRSSPVFADAGSTVLIGEQGLPESLYRLDGTDPGLPVVAEDHHGDVEGTQRMAITPDGARVFLGSGQVIRTSDIIPVGAIDEGYPVLEPGGTTAYALSPTHATAFETDTFSPVAGYDLTGCGFTSEISAAVMSSETTLVIAAGTRICQVTVKAADRLAEDRGELHPLEPTRILDTRSGLGGIPKVVDNASAQVAGRGGVPSTGASAVVMNVTVTEPTASSFLTVYPAGMPVPTASNLNYLPGDTVANLVTVKLGQGGKVALSNLAGSTHVIFDVVGWYSEADGLSGARFHPMAPERFVDTRERAGAPLGPGEVADLQVAGVASIPAQGVSAVVMNVTATEPTWAGFLTVWPGGPGNPVPLASNVNFSPGETRPNLVVVPVAADGGISVYNRAGSTHVVIDVVGWYDDGANPWATALRPLEPTRLLDTRIGLGAPVGKLGAGTMTLQVAGRGGVPAQWVSAVILNVTVVQPTAGSFLTVWPSGLPRPTASNLNYRPGQVVPNLVVVKVGPGGAVDLGNHFGEVDVVADVVGWFGPG